MVQYPTLSLSSNPIALDSDIVEDSSGCYFDEDMQINESTGGIDVVSELQPGNLQLNQMKFVYSLRILYLKLTLPNSDILQDLSGNLFG